MANFWFLFFTVLQIFHGSICAPDENLCGDSRLQYVFFLLPPSNEISELTEFLNKVKFAIVLVKPQDHGIVRVVCDPEDSREIYRYTKARDMYLLHSAYCIGNREFRSLEKFRSGREKARKIPVKVESPFNLINGKKSHGQKKTGDKNSLDELNAEVSRVLKYSRIPKPGENDSLQLSIEKNPPRKTNYKNTGTKSTPISKTAQKSSRKQSPVKNQGENTSKESTNDPQPEGSWIKRSFGRLKRYSWDFITKDKNLQKKSYSTHYGKTGDAKNATLLSKGPSNTEMIATVFGKDDVNRTRTTIDVMIPNVLSVVSESENNKQAKAPGSLELMKIIKQKEERDESGARSVAELTRNRRESTNATTEQVPKNFTTIQDKEEEYEEEDEDDEDEEEDTMEEDSDDDHSKYDNHDCLAAEMDTLRELADRIQSIFDWVKRLETRGKKG